MDTERLGEYARHPKGEILPEPTQQSQKAKVDASGRLRDEKGHFLPNPDKTRPHGKENVKPEDVVEKYFNTLDMAMTSATNSFVLMKWFRDKYEKEAKACTLWRSLAIGMLLGMVIMSCIRVCRNIISDSASSEATDTVSIEAK